MNRRRTIAIVAVFSLAFCLPASAQVVVVLFTGWNASTNGDTGMDELNLFLSKTDFGPLSYSGEVFQYFEQQQAFNFINSFKNIDCLVLVGHSFGADSCVELATDFLLPAGISVDVTVQLDSVGFGDDVLPVNVLHGYNYFQTATSLFEPQGETNVTALNPDTKVENYDVETLYGVANNVISHTDIDNAFFNYSLGQYVAIFGNQPDLHERIADHILAAKDANPIVLGDANDDGVLSNLDISAFVLALTNPNAYQMMFPDVDADVELDMNGDEVFDNLDIAGFVAALTGP